MRSSESAVSRLPLSFASFASFASCLCIALAGCANPNARPPDGQPGVACKDTNEQEIASLFDRWNASLQTGDPHQVAANYADKSILLPTVSNRPRLSMAEKEEYFQHFLQNRPSGKIDMRFIDIGCNMLVDAGLYTFTYGTTGQVVHARYTYTYRWFPDLEGGKWLITSHHSSALPEPVHE